MKTMSLRALGREAPSLEEIVLVTHEGSVIGQYFPLDKVQQTTAAALAKPDSSFGTFRPAPKPGKKS